MCENVTKFKKTSRSRLSRLSPEEEIEVDTKIKSIERWLIKCPGQCPISDLFEIMVMLQSDRRALLSALDFKENQYY